MRLAIVVKCDWSVGEILKKHVFKKLPGSIQHGFADLNERTDENSLRENSTQKPIKFTLNDLEPY